MSNTIRTPKEGVTNYSRRIAVAVDNEEWQKFRVSMKGKSTADKLDMLKAYFEDNKTMGHDEWPYVKKNEDVFIRVDNYIKALSRGGQLYAGESLATALRVNWRLRIKR